MSKYVRNRQQAVWKKAVASYSFPYGKPNEQKVSSYFNMDGLPRMIKGADEP